MEQIKQFIESLGSVGTMVILSAAVIILIVLFAKGIKWLLKLAVFAVMVGCILYFLHDAGMLGF